MAHLVLPRVQAMVLCDDIQESDQDNDAVNLIGVRTRILSPVFPTVHSLLCVFAQMSGHAGEARCHVEIESLASGEVIFETEALSFTFLDPTIVIPGQFRLANCFFAQPALYYVQVYFGDKLIGERPLLLGEE